MDTWHIVTEEGEFDFVQNEWQENVRFSAWRDINTEWRMGYIDAQDTEKMQRSNFVPEEGSVIVLLNRMNGKIFEVTRGIDAKNMFVYEERGVIFDGRDFYLVDL